MSTPVTSRGRAKEQRRRALLAAAARLFADRGFKRVSLEELGSAVGVSGPAVYRHFPSKQAVLAALLVDVSEGLLRGGQAVVDLGGGADATLDDLIAFHVDFAVTQPDVIRVQDRDLESLEGSDRHAVRSLQRRYVELWVRVLGGVRPGESAPDLRTRAHATFGLINSTPHSAGRSRDTRRILEQMARAALLS
ncbi:MAG: TetR/AcrR family transcriptional regulator [Actinomycetota bacterium]|nr:TetR/AcrR family transcriptional regulator [Actinomycetota bacterium]